MYYEYYGSLTGIVHSQCDCLFYIQVCCTAISSYLRLSSL